MKSIAVIGGGISGLGAAYELANAGVKVVLYEKEDYLGGHAKTVNVDCIFLDLGFMVFNRVSYPNVAELFDGLGIEVEASEMSFSVSSDEGQGCEWGSRNGLRSYLAQLSNAVKPKFWKMLQEIKKFKDDVIMYLEVLENNPDMDCTETLGHFIKSRSYSELFQKAYLIPMCASIWSCPSERVMDLSAFSALSFCRNHHLLQLSGGPQWLTMRGRSQQYVNKGVLCSVSRGGLGLVPAVPAPDAIRMLGKDVTHDEMRILGAFQYVYSDVYLHQDKKFMPRNPAAWSALNFQGSTLTYWLNVLQVCADSPCYQMTLYTTATAVVYCQTKSNGAVYCFRNISMAGIITSSKAPHIFSQCSENISEINPPFLLTLNPTHPPENILLKSSSGFLVPSVGTMKASIELGNIQGKRGIWFCGASHGCDFHEDGLKAGLIAANAVLKRNYTPVANPKNMVFSWTEAIARSYISRFLQRFIHAGCLMINYDLFSDDMLLLAQAMPQVNACYANCPISKESLTGHSLLEDGGTVLKFEGLDKRCTWKTAIRAHSPQFYWKVAIEADLGLADAFINGDISIVDQNEGLLNLFRIFLANLYLYAPASKDEKNSLEFKGWWTPMFFTAGIASAKYFYQHLSRQNSVTLARSNIARHYDLSNDMFSLFLDDTMTYSCAIFKSENEDLRVAQLRKLHLLIEKARVEKHHEVLDIGCGWGSLAIEIVKKTGCRYTGITLAEEQLKLAEQRVKEAGLEDHIRLLLCDYRQLPASHKFDRIISCGMLEHVGDKYYEDFFRHCESLLAENGLLVLQVHNSLLIAVKIVVKLGLVGDLIRQKHIFIGTYETCIISRTISIPDERYDGHKRSSDFMREYIFPGGCLPSLSRLTSAMIATSSLCVEHVENIGVHYGQTLRCWRKNFLENQRRDEITGDLHLLMQIVFSRQGNIVAFSDPYASIPSSHSFP
uniref:Cyclopropane-fatty-acyl-phospholipid synthase n=1 Tax=Chenopodium quinoa TaxID=63459 RepID=A0A803MTT4_CHEQI